MENIPIRKWKISQLVKRKYFQFELGNWEMAEEEEEQEDENKRIRPRERARGQKILDGNLYPYCQIFFVKVEIQGT